MVARSSAFSTISRLSALRRSARSLAVSAAQPGWAAWAASMAARVAAVERSGICASASPVAGLTTRNTLPREETVLHLPSMKPPAAGSLGLPSLSVRADVRVIGASLVFRRLNARSGRMAIASFAIRQRSVTARPLNRNAVAYYLDGTFPVEICHARYRPDRCDRPAGADHDAARHDPSSGDRRRTGAVHLARRGRADADRPPPRTAGAGRWRQGAGGARNRG